MNDESAIKRIVTEDAYMQSSEGLYVAWSLATPPHTFGEWSLLSIAQTVVDKKFVHSVEFVRQLEPEEVDSIYQQPYMWWGMKLVDEPWALVQCREMPQAGYKTARVRFKATDSIKTTGV